MSTSSSLDFSSVEAVYPQIQKRAAWLAFKWGLDAEDLAQEMTLRLLEKIAAGSLVDAPATQLMAHAQFEATHVVRADNCYRSYVSEETVTAGVSVLDFLPADETGNPEAHYIKVESACRLAARVRSLSAENRQVVLWLLVGYKKSEIAAKLGCGRSAVSHRLDVISAAISG